MRIVSHHIKLQRQHSAIRVFIHLQFCFFMKRSSLVFTLAIFLTVGVLYTTKASAAPFDCGGKKSECCTDKGGVKYYIDLVEKNQ